MWGTSAEPLASITDKQPRCCAKYILKPGEWIDDGTNLVSSGGNFVLGFFTPRGSSRPQKFVGIWYAWDPHTVVWVANRDAPVFNDSNAAFGIAEDGNLKLLDSGNLVLSDDQSLKKSLWMSFKNPTDTFLPGMTMEENLNLTSWVGDGDPGIGNFTFKQDQGGEGSYIISKKPVEYWRSRIPDKFSSWDEIPYAVAYLLSNFSGSTKPSKNDYYVKILTKWLPDYNCSRLVMNYSGYLEFWTCDQDKREWTRKWRQPEDECSVYNVCGKFGSCNIKNRGSSFLCRCLPGFKPSNPGRWNSGKFSDGCTGSDSTSCPSDTFLSLKMMKAAENRTVRGDIITNNVCWTWSEDPSNLREEYAKGGRNLSVRVAKYEIDNGTSLALELVHSPTLESTRRSCEPCGTYMIPYPLSTSNSCGDPRYFSFDCDASAGQVSFKAPSGTYRVASIDPNTRKFVIQVKLTNFDWYARNAWQPNLSLPFRVAGTADLGNSVSAYNYGKEISWDPPLEPTCTSAADCNDWPQSTCNATKDGMKRCLCEPNFRWNGLLLNCSKEINRSDKINRVLRTFNSEKHVKSLIDSGEFREEDEKDLDVPFFSLESILVATDSFSNANKLGQGGYGPVYKGTFPGGQEIAVKRLSSVSGQGLQEFKNEVVLIAKLQHRNLVRLRGFCIQRDENILLYEYMPNKSLDSFLFARGLLYLHQDSRLRIIHRDLKTSNILLDEEMNPKISDFGLARIVGGKETGDNTTRVVGTYGYMSPEYALEGVFSVKSDVFSFGVVLLEILSGRKNTGFYQSDKALSLIGYAWRLWVENKVLDLMDETLREVADVAQFVKFVNIALLCVQEDPSDRPNMSLIVTMLDNETATVPTPKRPAFVPRRVLSSSTPTTSSGPDTFTDLTSSLGEIS
ncbi:hypothetical protein CJ030_MR6G011339 [Morella rubra]|uniref:Receptor-like serine/threonine-protein kinase n=1 Tax=Morella rubra TaxID=262757 RepID=A0A6A1VC31_9ROSI|nr:hypothetical protein CJ030_MR6G011339 [Morella rubra]